MYLTISVQPPPTGDMQQKHDWDNAETKTSIWPLVHNYQTIPTSSTLPIFTTEVVNFNSSIGPKVTTINLPSVIVDIMTNQTLQMKVSARTSGQVLKTPSNLSSQPQLSDTPWPISTTTSEYRQGSLLGGKLAPNRRHTTTYETMANANITVDETDSFKTSTPTNNTPLV